VAGIAVPKAKICFKDVDLIEEFDVKSSESSEIAWII
jgi:hypothetical protein